MGLAGGMMNVQEDGNRLGNEEPVVLMDDGAAHLIEGVMKRN